MARSLDVVLGDRQLHAADERRPFVVVVGIDFGHAAIRGVDVAVRAAARHALAEVHLVAVAPPPLVLGSFSPFGTTREALDARRKQLDFVLATAHPPAWVRIFAHAIAGTAARSIVSEARRLAADLLILGTGGSHGPACLVLRSVAAKVLEDAPCAVMTIHPPRILPRAASAHFDL